MLRIIFLFIILIPSSALAISFDGKFVQGHFIIGKTQPKTEIWIDKKKIKVTKDGYFVFGIGRDRKYDIIITSKKDGKKTKTVKKVQKRKYKIQRIDGLPEKKVTPPKEVYERIKKENKIIADARAIESNLTFFKNKFILPLENAIITGVYGSQRILNGKPKWPHYGLDFAAKKGTKIKAMLDGTVTMVEPDLFYTGGTLIFDHGHGISTLYMHMEKIFVKKGQKVKQGDIIGTVGSTGRATGAHLDIRLNWFGTRLDPMSVLKWESNYLFKVTYRILKIITVNAIVFILSIISIEIFFGHWFSDNHLGGYMREHRMKKVPYSLTYKGQKYNFNYLRNYNGFRGEEIDLNKIKAIFIGGSTADERWKPEEHTIVGIINKKLKKDNIEF